MDSPGSVVLAFVVPFTRDSDLRTVWPLVDPLFRLCWAQWWACPLRAAMRSDGHDPDVVVEAFTADEPDHSLWPYFERTQLRARYPWHTWGTSSTAARS